MTRETPQDQTDRASKIVSLAEPYPLLVFDARQLVGPVFQS